MAADEPGALGHTSLRNAISNAMARIKREFYGKGPSRTRTFVCDRIVFAMLDDVLTPVELAMEGNVTRTGMPRPLHLALFVQRFRREVRAPFPPAWVVRALMSPLRAIARARGLGERYAPATA